MLAERKRYATSSIVFHWLIAVIVLILLSVSFFLGDLPEHMVPFAVMLHKSFGLSVLFLMLIRLGLIFYHGKPPLPQSVPTWEKVLARGVQYALYLFLLAMPFSGWLMSSFANKAPVFFGLFSVPLPVTPNQELAKNIFFVHQLIAWVLITLLVLHIAGALKHYFIDKDNVTQSMLP